MPYTVFMSLIALLLLALVPVQTQVPASPESAASGGKLYSRYCATCHGKEGKGDGSGGAKLNPTPSNLTDAEWKHGQGDAQIFAVIHDGVKDTGMKGFGSRMTEHEIWDVVNYVKTLKQ